MSPQTTSTSSPPRSLIGRPLVWVAVLAVGTTLYLATRPGVTQIAVPAEILQRIATLEATVETEAAQRARLEQIVTRLNTPTPLAVDAQGQIPADAVLRLGARLLEQQLALGTLQLYLAVQSSRPFERELSVLRDMYRSQEELGDTLDALAPRAAIGVATVAELRDVFGVVLLPKLQALEGGSGEALMQRLQSWWQGISGGIEPATANTDQRLLIGSALDRLSANNLQGAVQILEQLDGDAARLTARWITEAEARLTVDSAADTLNSIVIRLLGRRPAEATVTTDKPPPDAS